MDLQTFKKKFHEIQQMGFIPTKRRGNTGIGYTLEELLGISENNIDAPDLDDIELKAHRSDSSSMITLFTYDRKVWIMPPLKAVRKYGKPDKNPEKKNRLNMYYTMSLTPNDVGLYLSVNSKTVSVHGQNNELIAQWTLEMLAKQFVKKLPALLLVSADTQEINNREHFKFTKAQLMRGTSPHLLEQQFKNGNLLLDLRLHDRGTSARNHGTGFRAHERALPYIFSDIQEL